MEEQRQDKKGTLRPQQSCAHTPTTLGYASTRRSWSKPLLSDRYRWLAHTIHTLDRKTGS